LKEYSLIITYICNWFCTYCITDTHAPGKGQIPLEVIKEKLDKVEEGSLITLTGGEPGYAKKEIMDYTMETLLSKKCHIMVNTNGAFFSRYPEHVPNIHEFVYHCSESMDINDEFIQPDLDNIRYLVVVTDETIDRLEPFMDKYPHITFHVSAGADTKMYSQLPNRTSLSKMNAIKIVQKYKDRISETSIPYLLNKCSDIKESIDL